MPACPSDADRSLREDAFRDVVLFRAYLCGSMAGRFNPTKRGGTNISFSCPFMPFLAPLRLGKRMPNVFTRCSSSVESIPTPNDKESSIVSFKKQGHNIYSNMGAKKSPPLLRGRLCHWRMFTSETTWRSCRPRLSPFSWTRIRDHLRLTDIRQQR